MSEHTRGKVATSPASCGRSRASCPPTTRAAGRRTRADPEPALTAPVAGWESRCLHGIKQLTLVRQSAFAPPGQFVTQWRDTALAELDLLPASCRPDRLAHAVVREGRSPRPHRGVELAWFASGEAASGHNGWRAARVGTGPVVDPASSTILRVEERCVFGESWLEQVWRRSDGPPTLVLIGFLERVPHLSRSEFRSYWWDRHRPLANSLIPPELQPLAYVHDYVVDGDPSRWDGIGELYERDLDGARRRGAWFESPAAGPLLDDENRFLVRATRMVLITDLDVIVG